MCWSKSYLSEQTKLWFQIFLYISSANSHGLVKQTLTFTFYQNLKTIRIKFYSAQIYL